MTDILCDLISEKITLKDAEIIFDNTVSGFHSGKVSDICSELNLNKYEWTAICQGIDFDVLAMWRKNGWPTYCNKCKSELNYKDFGWLIKNNSLCHIFCSENL